MTDLDVQDAAAKADDMANTAFLAASMIEERAADIVEALNDISTSNHKLFCAGTKLKRSIITSQMAEASDKFVLLPPVREENHDCSRKNGDQKPKAVSEYGAEQFDPKNCWGGLAAIINVNFIDRVGRCLWTNEPDSPILIARLCE